MFGNTQTCQKQPAYLVRTGLPVLTNLLHRQLPLCRSPTARNMTMSKRDVYIANIKLQLDELNLKMSKVEAKALEAKEDAR